MAEDIQEDAEEKEIKGVICEDCRKIIKEKTIVQGLSVICPYCNSPL